MESVTATRSKWIVLTLAAVALLWPATAESPVGAATAAVVPAQAAAVTVEHELVLVSAPTSVAPAPRRRPTPSAVRLTAGPGRSLKPAGFALRAGRALIGDGRYRPEPFPRPGRR
jgi:hypothetical protein